MPEGVHFMNGISLKQLEIFVAVVEYSGFTRAAEELFVRSNRRHVRLT